MHQETILIVEDDAQLREALEKELGKSYKVHSAPTGGDGMFIAETQEIDLIILDLNLPDMDGIEVAQHLSGEEVDILMLTARGDVHSRISGLYGGASDYLAKPFEMQELLARIYALLRKRSRPEQIRVGELVFSHRDRSCTVGGETVELSGQEFRLLSLFISNRGRVFSKSTIEDRLYGASMLDSNNIEVLVSRLRAKLDAKGARGLIQTIRGLGYVLR